MSLGFGLDFSSRLSDVSFDKPSGLQFLPVEQGRLAALLGSCSSGEGQTGGPRQLCAAQKPLITPQRLFAALVPFLLPAWSRAVVVQELLSPQCNRMLSALNRAARSLDPGQGRCPAVANAVESHQIFSWKESGGRAEPEPRAFHASSSTPAAPRPGGSERRAWFCCRTSFSCV